MGPDIKPVARGPLPAGAIVPSASCASFHPELPDVVSVAATGADVRVYDARAGLDRPSQTITDAQALQIRAVDYDPGRGGVAMATCSDDGAVRTWDLRNSSRPTGKAVNGHAHNPEYPDRLYASCGGDGAVRLWNPPDGAGGAGDGEKDETRTLRSSASFAGSHADTAYQVAWGRGDDPWTLASVSYDGRVVLDQVPRAEKYRILL